MKPYNAGESLVGLSLSVMVSIRGETCYQLSVSNLNYVFGAPEFGLPRAKSHAEATGPRMQHTYRCFYGDYSP